MPRLADTTDRLAMRVASGNATHFQKELLGSILLDAAKGAALSAVSSGILRRCDADDAASIAAIKAWCKLSEFKAGKAGLKTWVSAITQRVVGDFRRQYAKDATHIDDDADLNRL